MLDKNKKSTVEVVHLKHMALEPQVLKCSLDSNILIKITNNNSCSFESRDRKFLFALEQTDEESPLLGEGEEYLFVKPLDQPGSYNLQCLNYTKIRCCIEVQGTEGHQQQAQISQSIKPSSPPCDLTEVVQERDEEIKDIIESAQQQEDKHNQNSGLADYERILSDEEMHYDYMPNKYLKYFKEEFKLWRDFFDHTETPKTSNNKKEVVREGASSGSLSLSQRESIKQESVVSHLRSQQEMFQVHEQQINRPKIMKKTNSEYCLNVERQTEKAHPSQSKRKQINTNTSSPNPRTQQSEADSFVDWAWGWAEEQNLSEVIVPRLNDRHLVRQWLTFLQNKFKISEIMYG